MFDSHILSQYQKIIEEVNIVSKTNQKGIITYVNDKFCEISGYTREELIGKPHNIVRHEDMSKSVFKDLRITIQEKKQTWIGVVKNKKKNGGFYWVKTSVSPILDTSGNITEFISIRTDITDLEVAKIKLKQSLHELKHLDKQKDEFLNISSHELRTPMTSIKGYLSMILDGDIGKIDQEAEKYLSKVYENVEGLLSLINDMLDIIKIESGKMSFSFEQIHLKQFIQDLSKTLEKDIQKKDIQIEFDLENEIYLFGDKARIGQAIFNILENAIMYNKIGGKIYVKTFVNQKKIHILIKDTGIGISKKDYKKIFSKFGQVKNSLTRDIGGTGLGLSISEAILMYYKGKIEVSSRLGKGAQFDIVIPL